MQRLEHIGIAVKNLDQSNALYEKLLGVKHYK
ncbi:MAG: methylmalonyl-CoA epimerase, partial [Bacteroidota bacterium]